MARAILANRRRLVVDDRPRDSFGWVVYSPSFVPFPDASAAALVRLMTENRQSDNANPNSVVGDANHYVPSAAELNTYLTSERFNNGLLPAELNPYAASVTGNFAGTTDEIIQWASIKWGIPPDWMRAQAVNESYWRHTGKGDLAQVISSTPYPAYSRVDATHVYQSLGILQIKWNHPDDNHSGAGTEPIRWKSTAFNADYTMAAIRFYFDDPQGKRSDWGDPTYQHGQQWLSLAAWYEPYPWNNSGQANYANTIQGILASRTWEQSDFPPPLPR